MALPETPMNLRLLFRQLDTLPTLKEVPEILIEEAVRRSDGNLSAAASLLGITSQAICNRRRRARERSEQCDGTAA